MKQSQGVPRGTATVVLGDVAGSTRLWAQAAHLLCTQEALFARRRIHWLRYWSGVIEKVRASLPVDVLAAGMRPGAAADPDEVVTALLRDRAVPVPAATEARSGPGA